MASLVLHFIFFFTFFLPFTLATATRDACATASPDGSDNLSIIPINAKCSPFAPSHSSASVIDSVLHMASADSHRLTYLSSLVAGKPKQTAVPVASGNQLLHIGNYVVRARLGTPPQLMFMVLDTSNDAAWLPCSGCSGCSTAATAASFNPNSSSTYSTVSCSSSQCTQARGLTCPSSSPPSICSFNQTYGGDSSFSASLVQDTLTLASDVIPNFSFGCIKSVSGNSLPPQGLMGLGRGPMSLVSQTTSLYSGVFSYCLPSFRSFYFSGSLKLGLSGQPRSIRYTPLLRNPRRPSLYYVNLTGVSVGPVQVPIDPTYLTFDSNSGAGTIIDSGTVITRFVQPVYEAIRDGFRKQGSLVESVPKTVNEVLTKAGSFCCFVDASWLSNTTPFGIGWALYRQDTSVIVYGSTSLPPIHSPLEAECEALRLAVLQLSHFNYQHVTFCGDLKQLYHLLESIERPGFTGDWKHTNLYPYVGDILRMIQFSNAFNFMYISRQANLLADRLSKNARTTSSGYVISWHNVLSS